MHKMSARERGRWTAIKLRLRFGNQIDVADALIGIVIEKELRRHAAAAISRYKRRRK